MFFVFKLTYNFCTPTLSGSIPDLIRFLLKQVFDNTGKCGSYILIDLRDMMMPEPAHKLEAKRGRKKRIKSARIPKGIGVKNTIRL
jgi:hypothetical protein